MVGANMCTSTETNITFASKLFWKGNNGATSKINKTQMVIHVFVVFHSASIWSTLISSAVQASFFPILSLTYYVNGKGNIKIIIITVQM